MFGAMSNSSFSFGGSPAAPASVAESGDSSDGTAGRAIVVETVDYTIDSASGSDRAAGSEAQLVDGNRAKSPAPVPAANSGNWPPHNREQRSKTKTPAYA